MALLGRDMVCDVLCVLYKLQQTVKSQFLHSMPISLH